MSVTREQVDKAQAEGTAAAAEPAGDRTTNPYLGGHKLLIRAWHDARLAELERRRAERALARMQPAAD